MGSSLRTFSILYALYSSGLSSPMSFAVAAELNFLFLSSSRVNCPPFSRAFFSSSRVPEPL